MEIVVGIICGISFLLGNILAIAYSLDLLKNMVSYHNRNMDIDPIISSVLITIATIFPAIMSCFLFIEMLQSYIQKSWFAVIFLNICFFGLGIKWTKFMWPQIESIEGKYFPNKVIL